MNDELLQKLFTDLRNAPTETPLEEVAVWIKKTSFDISGSNTKKLLPKTKIITMTTVITLLATSAILLLGPQKDKIKQGSKVSSSPAKEQLSATSKMGSATRIEDDIQIEQEFEIDTQKAKQNTQHSEPHSIIITANNSVHDPTSTEKIESIDFKKSFADQPLNKDQGPDIEGVSNDTTGSWITNAESLHIDTLFSGVTELVLTSNYPSKINILGAKQADVAFKYQYEHKLKGVFVGRNPGNKVTYFKAGPILTIVIEQNKTWAVGISYGKIVSDVSLLVPENIKVRINSSYGDIVAKQLGGETIQLHTKYGDIKAQSLTGNINLQSGYGDIGVEEATGKVDLSTRYGDIKANKIKGAEAVTLFSGYGDIDCKLTSKEESLRLNLSTGYGKLSAKGKEIDIESSKKILYGKGDILLTASSKYGDIKISFVEQ